MMLRHLWEVGVRMQPWGPAIRFICTLGWDDKLSPSHVVESVAYDCFVECGVMQIILTPQHHQLFFQ
jgi:hypothetical protein